MQKELRRRRQQQQLRASREPVLGVQESESASGQARTQIGKGPGAGITEGSRWTAALESGILAMILVGRGLWKHRAEKPNLCQQRKYPGSTYGRKGR